MRHRHAAAIHDVHAIIVPIGSAAHGHALQREVLAIDIGLHPASRVLHREVPHSDARAVHQFDHLRPVLFGWAPAVGGVTELSRLHQPHHVRSQKSALPIHGASAGDSNVVRVPGLDECQPAVFLIVRMLRTPQQRRPFLDAQGHAAFQVERAAQEHAMIKQDCAAGLGRRINRPLDRDGVLGLPVARRAEDAGIESCFFRCIEQAWRSQQ